MVAGWGGENLINDPGFETVGDAGERAIWRLTPPNLNASQSVGENGNNLQIVNPADSEVESPFVQQWLSLKADTKYEVHYSAMGESEAKYRVYVEWVDADGFHNAGSGFLPSDGGWNSHSFDFHYPGGASSIYIVFQVQGAGKVLFSKPMVSPLAK